MTKRMTIMVLALIIVFGGLLGFNLFRNHMMKKFFANFTLPAVSVSTVTAKKDIWYPVINAVGSFVAINGVDVNAQSSGNVTQIHFESGQFVKKDTPLINIDDSIDQASLKDAQANLTLQDLNYKRQVDLFKRQATSTSNVDQARANLTQARANVEKIQAEINQKHIKAPFAGRLGVRLINLGEYINPGSTKIVTLQSVDPLFLEFYLPEQYLNQLHVGQDIRFSVQAYEGRRFTGKITAINSKVDINTHNVLIQATIDNCSVEALKKEDSPLAIREKDPLGDQRITLCDSKKNESNDINQYAFTPGMFANIEVLQPPKEKVIILPRTAVSYTLYGNSVFVVNEKTDKKTGKKIKVVNTQFIKTGEERGNSVVIKTGVKEGDIVVNSGQLKLRNGTTVVINNDVKLNVVPNPDSLGQ